MKATVFPGKASGTIHVPPSKSIAHRAIICASLAKGKSLISNLDYSDDILATIDCMRMLGASIEEIDSDEQDRKTIEVIGIDHVSHHRDLVLHCKESGSTLRFLIPLAALSSQTTTFMGENRLLYRPQSIYHDIFEQQGLFMSHDLEKIVIQGQLKPDHFTINGNVSSQFISGLLFALPLLQEASSIEITLPYESKSYVDLTIQTLKTFGIVINELLTYDESQRLISCRYEIPGNQSYQAVDYTVEGDYSQLAFFGVLGAINSPITCLGVREDSLQGDKAILSFLHKSGAMVETVANGYCISPGQLQGTSFDIQDCPDIGPILMVLAMFSSGCSQLENTARLKIKESDRAEAMAVGLRKLGVDIAVHENEVRITDSNLTNIEIEISGYLDHRIVMSFAIAATSCKQPVTITDAQAVAKSYPRFFDDLQSLGIEVKFDDSYEY